MTYEGNQLTSVRDNASRYSYAGATDFDGIPGQEYPLTYNDAGSLTSDAGRRIAWIDYDLMNNPVRIQFTNGNVTKYVYSAAGEKLRVTYQTAVPNITVPIGSTRELAFYEVQYTDSTEYLLDGRLTLKNGRIDKYQFEEGYCQAGRFNDTKDVFTFYYYDRDHLGSIRQVLTAKTGSVVQSMNYYPFGAQFCDGSTDSNVQSHRYNGKEFDKMHGLNTYDYGARQYNPITARWDRVDPLAEKYYSMSPYNYCGNNPVNAIDEKGDSVCVLNLGNGTNQHLGMLIQNDKGTWSYYSFNGTSIYSSTSGSVGGAPHNNLGEKTFVSPMAFLNSQYNSDGSKGLIERDKINGYGYTEGYILPTSPKEDIVIRDNFVKTVNDGYDLIFNQCADAVKNALNSVGIDTSVFNYDVSIPLPGKNSHNIPLFSIKIEPYLPSKTFEAIRSNNSDGIYIKK